MTIFVGNLSFDVTESDLVTLFSAFGEVSEVRIMDDRYIGSQRPYEYAYIDMPSREATYAAIQALDGTVLKQREMHVVQALPLSNNASSSASKKTRQRI